MSIKKCIGAVAIALVAAYVGGRYYFSNHFYPRTTINTVDCSVKSAADAIQLNEDYLNTYTLTIHDSVTNMIVTASDAGLHYTGLDEVPKLLAAQDENLWFTEFYKEHNYTAMSHVLDQEKLKAYIDQLECMNPAKPQKPVSAKLSYDKKSKSYVFTDEIIGNTVVPELLYEAAEKCILNGESTLDLTTNEYYKQPKHKVADKDVQKAKATVDKYMSSVINYKHADLTYTLDSKDIHKFIKISKDFKISFEKDKMKTYVKKHISKVYDTVGHTRTVHSPASGTFNIEGGSFGWKVSLVKERDQMLKDIKSGKTIERKPVYIQDANQRKKKSNNDIGNSYVDVNISRQTLYVVKDGKVTFQSSFVSGNPNNGHQTDKGVYAIEFKMTNYEMRDYHVTVKYWMPFNTDVGEGFHDATWRGSFGGSIYLSNGSHGCVNLPYEVASHLYNTLPVGYPVIVH